MTLTVAPEPATVAPAATRRRPGNALLILAGALTVAVAFLILYPLAGMLTSLFLGEEGAGLGAFAEASALPGLAETLRNTGIVLAASTLLAVVLGSGFAWVNERSDARIGWMTEILPIIPLLVPPIAGAIGWALLGTPNAGFLNVVLRDVLGWFGIVVETGPLNVYSWYGLIFVYTLYMVPHVYLTVAAGLRNVDPSLEEAARSSGSGPWRTVLRVTLPSVKPAIIAGTLLALVIGLALYSVPVIIGTQARIDVLAVTIVRLLTVQFPPQTEVAVVLGLILLVVISSIYLLQVRVLRRSRFATIGGRGQRQARVRLGWWRRPAQALMLTYVVLTSILPLAGLLLVSLQSFWSATIDWSSLSLASYYEVIVDRRQTQLALRNSLLLGVLGATAAVLAAALIAYAVRLYLAGPLRTVVNGVTKLPGAMSHIVIGVAFVAAFAGPPFQLAGTVLLLFLCYIVLYMPQASVSAESALAQIGGELPEAARVFGASPGRTLRRVVLPLMVPGLAAGWALVFVLMSGDITASVMLAGTRNPVVGSVTLDLWTNGTYPQLAALSVVITIASSVVVLTSMRLARRLSRRT